MTVGAEASAPTSPYCKTHWKHGPPVHATNLHYPYVPDQHAGRSSDLKDQFRQLLHDYKKEVFHAEHDRSSVDEITAECLHITEDVLQQKYSYHFHKLPDADRAEIINMISNYTREAILPPIVEAVVRRQVIQDKKINALVHLVEQLFEAVSGDPAGAPAE